MGGCELVMKRIALAGFIISLFFASSAEAARVVAAVDLSRQRMHVYVNEVYYYTWRISTGRRGYRTPSGVFRPKRLERRWFSRKYNWTPMPHSVFFLGGYAIHGTYQTRRLGRPVSHGCIRLHPSNAARLFHLIRRYGRRNTRIIIRR